MNNDFNNNGFNDSQQPVNNFNNIPNQQFSNLNFKNQKLKINI